MPLAANHSRHAKFTIEVKLLYSKSVGDGKSEKGCSLNTPDMTGVLQKLHYQIELWIIG